MSQSPKNEAQANIEQVANSLERPLGSERSDIRPPSRQSRHNSPSKEDGLNKTPSTTQRLELFPEDEPIAEVPTEYEMTGAAISPVPHERLENILNEQRASKDSEVPTTPKSSSANKELIEKLAKLEADNEKLTKQLTAFELKPTLYPTAEEKSEKLSVRMSQDGVVVPLKELQETIERLEKENNELKVKAAQRLAPFEEHDSVKTMPDYYN